MNMFYKIVSNSVSCVTCPPSTFTFPLAGRGRLELTCTEMLRDKGKASGLRFCCPHPCLSGGLILQAN